MSGPIYNAVRRSRGSNVPPSQASPTSAYSGPNLSDTDIKAATKGRKAFAIFTSFLFLVSLVFLILINIGNVSNHHVLGDIYFFKLDTSRIIPTSVPNARLLNSLARSIGLHDFYQVGMWSFCEGFNGVGITACSKPRFLYWFNPVQIILEELLDGATVSIPTTITKYLNIIRLASRAMFVCFFASTFTSFLAIFLAPLSVHSRLTAIPIAIFTLLSALMTTVAAVIATVMWSIFANQLHQAAADINIGASVGRMMLIFMWIAAGCALLGAVGQLGMCCCCTSRRDIRTGRKEVKGGRVGRKERYEGGRAMDGEEENPALRRRWWGSLSDEPPVSSRPQKGS